MNKNLLFSLDIGTRSVIGIVAEKIGKDIKIIAAERKEHNTRAMLDGQIHDVPEVAAILEAVKLKLEDRVGTLNHAAVAAAGRALYTITAEAEMEISEMITPENERTLELSAIQAAQKKLATSNTVDDPTLYYCVGYSTITYKLDNVPLKTLVGQRGKKAHIEVIATFLPRQVIDSMQSALIAANLEMSALTLEPIAAINVLIPPTMRHLNLVLVDIGAGTSDVAITKNGTIIGYGMVPLAGDEITEALSQAYLLDFNVAERIKRELTMQKTSTETTITFSDILGIEYNLSPTEIVEQVKPNVGELAQAIANQIIALNKESPQAVLLVGGGSLTPLLPEMLAQALEIPAPRVAVRRPDTIHGMEFPDELKQPDNVTPLGILKVAASQSLHFITVHVNNTPYRLFNIGKLTLSDALLAAGIGLKDLNGKPGLAITITINKQTKFIPGTMGTAAELLLNNEKTTLDTEIKDGDKISVVCGINGKAPTVYLKDVVEPAEDMSVLINNENYTVSPILLVNDKPAKLDQQLKDRDIVTYRNLKNLGEILVSAGYSPQPHRFTYTVNGVKTQHSVSTTILVNDEPATVSHPIEPNDEITLIEPKVPQLGKVLQLETIDKGIYIYFNKKKHFIPTSHYTIKMNGNNALLDDVAKDGAEITYELIDKGTPILSDILFTVGYKAPSAFSKVSVEILLNNQPAEYITPVKSGDNIEVITTPLKG